MNDVISVQSSLIPRPHVYEHHDLGMRYMITMCSSG